ncbi:MAG: hypothetical protein AAGF48_03110 [Pseudomonadota bacterium]
MKGLVWALYLMVQDPSTGVGSGQSLAFTGVTYLHKTSCVSDAKTFSEMGTSSKAEGVDAKAQIIYLCVLQPKPDHYKG